jgi:hypothetical protein
VRLFWNQEVHTDREVMANRPDIIIKKQKKEKCTMTDASILDDRNAIQKKAENKIKIQGFMLRDITTKVEHEMYDNTGSNWSRPE